MNTYKVTITAKIDAAYPAEAAMIFHEHQKSADTAATKFNLVDEDGCVSRVRRQTIEGTNEDIYECLSPTQAEVRQNVDAIWNTRHRYK